MKKTKKLTAARMGQLGRQIQRMKRSYPSDIACAAVGLPPGKSCPGHSDRIRNDGKLGVCFSCYGKGGMCKFDQCIDLLDHNWQAYKACKNQAELNQLLLDVVPRSGRGYFRWQWNGDVPSLRYAKAIVYVAKQLPSKFFLVPTKTKFFDDLEVPGNLMVKPSAHRLNEPAPTGGFAVYTKDEELPEGHFICKKPCDKCGYLCWHHAIPVVLKWHGCASTRHKMRKEGFNV